jgi:hypothetical protein
VRAGLAADGRRASGAAAVEEHPAMLAQPASVGTLARTLRVKPGQRVLVLNAPDGYVERLEPLPSDARLVERARDAVGDQRGFDAVHLFVRDRAELDRLAPAALAIGAHDAPVWICYPKRSSKVATDLTRDVGWDAVTAAGFVGVAQVAVDETWTATRFRRSELVGRR